jgi:hypothetical protein
MVSGIHYMISGGFLDAGGEPNRDNNYILDYVDRLKEIPVHIVHGRYDRVCHLYQAELRLRYFCSPYRQDSALFPFVEQLGHAAEFSRDDVPAVKLEKLEALLARAANRARMWHSSPICCHCRFRNATRCRASVRSGKKSGCWRR